MFFKVERKKERKGRREGGKKEREGGREKGRKKRKRKKEEERKIGKRKESLKENERYSSEGQSRVGSVREESGNSVREVRTLQ